MKDIIVKKIANVVTSKFMEQTSEGKKKRKSDKKKQKEKGFTK